MNISNAISINNTFASLPQFLYKQTNKKLIINKINKIRDTWQIIQKFSLWLNFIFSVKVYSIFLRSHFKAYSVFYIYNTIINNHNIIGIRESLTPEALLIWCLLNILNIQNFPNIVLYTALSANKLFSLSDIKGHLLWCLTLNLVSCNKRKTVFWYGSDSRHNQLPYECN